MLLMKKMCLVFVKVIQFHRVRAGFCWDKEDRISRITELTFAAWENWFLLFLFCVDLFYFSILTYLIIGEFFLVTLGVGDVVQIIDGIVSRDFSLVE